MFAPRERIAIHNTLYTSCTSFSAPLISTETVTLFHNFCMWVCVCKRFTHERSASAKFCCRVPGTYCKHYLVRANEHARVDDDDGF